MKNWLRNITRTLATTLGLLCALTANAQLEMGGWQTHFSYNGVSQVVQTPEKIYAVSSGNLFSIDKEYNSLEIHSKLTGLSDGNILLTAYNEEKDVLVICYSSFVIDIIDHGKVYKMTDIANKDISGKTINNISFGGKYIYLSCGFGIVAINSQKKEVANTYIIGPKGSYLSVLQTEITADSIYALTANALYTASLKDNNLANYEHWNSRSIPDNAAKTICFFGDRLNLFGANWYVWGNGWEEMPYTYINNVDKAHTYKNKLLVVSSKNSFAAIFNKDFTQDTIIVEALNDAIYDTKTDLLWLAEDTLKAVEKSTGKIVDKYCPEGPLTNTVSFMKFNEGKIVSGYGPNWGDNGIVQQFDGTNWVSFGRFDIEDPVAQYKFLAIYDITYDPKDNRRMYVSTWRSIFEFYDNKFVKIFTYPEAPFIECATVPDIFAIEKTSFDEEGNMWVMNPKGGNLMYCLDVNGQWHSLNCPSVFSISDVSDFMIAKKSKIKAITAPKMNEARETCLFLMESGSKAYTVANQRIFKNFTITDGTTVSPSKINCVTEDGDGDLWVGTDIGPFVLKNISTVFNKDYKVTRIKITRRDDATLADYLLSTEVINSIAVDGANRKWIGTSSSGVYVLSSDGQETIHHFTTTNSPLTTNSITKIDINPSNGMVYIQTPNGLLSYKSDAAEGKETLDDVHVYPNPVRPGYSGMITVTGLMEDTEVRITDATGRVVCHGKSNGSVFTWDGYLSSGSRAATGIYYVFQATKDGENSNVAKFAIIKK